MRCCLLSVEPSIETMKTHDVRVACMQRNIISIVVCAVDGVDTDASLLVTSGRLTSLSLPDQYCSIPQPRS